MAPDENSSNQMVPITRPLAAIIVPILLTAFIMLFLFPNRTGLLFAWPVKPTMSAMMLGATYLGGAYFFSEVFRARQWQSVKLGFLPVSAFAAILGVATLLHWDKFTPGHISFILWAFLYLTLPFVLPVVWILNQRLNRAIEQPAAGQLSAPFSWAMGGLGVVMAGASLILLVMPDLLIPSWPWTLSPLTARVLAAMFALTGFVALGVAIDRTWAAARIPLRAQAMSIVLILISLIRASSEILWDDWRSWLFVAGLLLSLLMIIWAHIEGRNRAPTA